MQNTLEILKFCASFLSTTAVSIAIMISAHSYVEPDMSTEENAGDVVNSKYMDGGIGKNSKVQYKFDCAFYKHCVSG